MAESKFIAKEGIVALNRAGEALFETTETEVIFFKPIFLSGPATELQTVTLTIEDNLIEINSNQTGTPLATMTSGFEVNRGDLNNYYFYFVENDDSFKIGELGSLQSVATRQDMPFVNSIPFWNSTQDRFDTDENFVFINGNIGIGKTNPQHELDVNGDILSNRIFLSNAEIRSDTKFSLLALSTGNAQGINVGSIGVDSSYANANANTPTNGIWSLGGVSTSGRITSSFSGSEAIFYASGNPYWYMFGFGARDASIGAYGIGLTDNINNRTMSFHIPNHAAYSSVGNVPKFSWYSNGPVELMSLQSATGNLSVSGSISTSSTLSASGIFDNSGLLTISGTSPTIRFADSDHYDFWAHVNSNRFYILADRDGNNTWDAPHPLQLDAATNEALVFGNEILDASNYVPYVLSAVGGSNLTNGITFSGDSSYWISTASFDGLYYDSVNNEFEFHGAATAVATIDLDNGNMSIGNVLNLGLNLSIQYNSVSQAIEFLVI